MTNTSNKINVWLLRNWCITTPIQYNTGYGCYCNSIMSELGSLDLL